MTPPWGDAEGWSHRPVGDLLPAPDQAVGPAQGEVVEADALGTDHVEDLGDDAGRGAGDDRAELGLLDQGVDVDAVDDLVDVDAVDDLLDVDTVDDRLDVDLTDDLVDVDALDELVDVDLLDDRVDVDRIDDHGHDALRQRLRLLLHPRDRAGAHRGNGECDIPVIFSPSPVPVRDRSGTVGTIGRTGA